MSVRLRMVEDADLDQVFERERDPGAVAMAAFTRADPSDRAAFDRHYERIRNDLDCTLLAIDDDEGAFAGTIGSFTMEGEREVTYWIAPSRWAGGLPRLPSTRLLRSS
jgi:RimJ/RimL family protein N-acetyltransferase